MDPLPMPTPYAVRQIEAGRHILSGDTEPVSPVSRIDAGYCLDRPEFSPSGCMFDCYGMQFARWYGCIFW